MKTLIALELNIISITTKIKEEFPELSKYIVEMPLNNSEEEAVNIKNLQNYRDSLQTLLNTYADSHLQSEKKEGKSNGN